MTCIAPPALDTMAIAKFLEDEADDRVVQHLKACPHCRHRARRLAQEQVRLKAQLYRATCPPPEQLRDYHFGLLTSGDAALTSAHLTRCPHCSLELVELSGYLNAEEAAPAPNPFGRLKEQVQVMVAQLVGGLQDLTATSPFTLAAGVRGEEESTALYRAGEMQISLDLQESPGQPSWQTIFGLLLGADDAEMEAVDLWRERQLIATTPIEPTGNFVLQRLPPGTYEMIIRGDALTVQIPNVTI